MKADGWGEAQHDCLGQKKSRASEARAKNRMMGMTGIYCEVRELYRQLYIWLSALHRTVTPNELPTNSGSFCEMSQIYTSKLIKHTYIHTHYTSYTTQHIPCIYSAFRYTHMYMSPQAHTATSRQRQSTLIRQRQWQDFSAIPHLQRAKQSEIGEKEKLWESN